MNESSTLKYKQIAEWIRERIQDGTFSSGEKLLSENQLCEKFSISRQTARQAIQILVDDGLVSPKKGSGTFINDLPKKGQKTQTIGVMTTYLDDYIFPRIISGIEKVLSQSGYQMTLRLTRNKVLNERSQLENLLASHIDGLIVEGTKTALHNPNLDIYQKFYEQGIPVIFINAYYQDLPCDYIVNGDEEGAQLATRRLIQCGHKKIAGIFKHDDLQGKLRYKGFLNEMYGQGLSIDDQAILWYSTENEEDVFNANNFPYLLKKFENCTAVICYNDQIAMKLIQIFNSSTLSIPEDLSLVSFDNSPLAEISSIPLSSVTHPSLKLGSLAAESILKKITDPNFNIQHVFVPEFMERTSLAKAPALK